MGPGRQRSEEDGHEPRPRRVPRMCGRCRIGLHLVEDAAQDAWWVLACPACRRTTRVRRDLTEWTPDGIPRLRQ